MIIARLNICREYIQRVKTAKRQHFRNSENLVTNLNSNLKVKPKDTKIRQQFRQGRLFPKIFRKQQNKS